MLVASLNHPLVAVQQHGTFGQTKVGMEVHGVGGVNELRVPHGVAGVLVHPRVETGVIVVTDLFPWGGGAMQLRPPKNASRGCRGGWRCRDAT